MVSGLTIQVHLRINNIGRVSYKDLGRSDVLNVQSIEAFLHRKCQQGI